MQLENGLRVNSIFEPGMSGRTGQRPVFIMVIVLGGSFSGSHLEGRVMTQFLVIVAVFVSGGPGPGLV